MMDSELKEVYLTCQDRCTTLRFTYDNDENWNITSFEMLDDRVVKETPFLWRLKRAWYVLREKPLCYAEVMATDNEKTKYFLRECLRVIEEGEKKNEKFCSVPDCSNDNHHGVVSD